MKKFTSLATIVAIALAGASQANAQSFSTSSTASTTPAAPTLTFDSPLPSGFSLNGGQITNTGAAPLGGSGNYLLVAANGHARLNTSTAFDTVNFLWGSIDGGNSNKVSFFDEVGQLISSLLGTDVATTAELADPNFTTSPGRNKYLTYSTAGTGRKVASLQFEAQGGGFEVDNFRFSNAPTAGTSTSTGGTTTGGTSTSGGAPVSVPEPGMLALFGLGALGLMASKRKRKLAAA